jgi:uncharacterized protein YbjT (DUF2867 family)
MDIVIGASGQVGSAVVEKLVSGGRSVRGIVRDEKKAGKVKELGAHYSIATLDDGDSLAAAFQGGDTLLALTPETGKEADVIKPHPSNGWWAFRQSVPTCREIPVTSRCPFYLNMRSRI